MTTTDAPTSTAPWPVPEASNMAADLSLLLSHLADLDPVIDAAVIDLVEAKPVARDVEAMEVWRHDVAMILDVLDAHRAKVQEVFEYAAADFARSLPFGTSHVAYPDLRPMIPRFGGDRKGWRNDLLQADVTPRLLNDPETGETRTPRGVLEAVLSVVSLIGSNVKTTGVKALGLVPDDYCHVEKKPPTVQFVK